MRLAVLGMGRIGHALAARLLEHYDGSGWSIVSSPNGSGRFSRLEGVTCAASSYCIAAGTAGLIEHYDGSGWSVVSGLSQGSGELLGVSCTRRKFCVAVGAQDASTLIEQSTRGAWMLAESPNRGTRSVLNAVTCIPNCFAVGYSEESGLGRTLIEQGPTALSLAPIEGTPGSAVIVTGAGFPAERAVKLSFTDHAKIKTGYPNVRTNASGEFATEISIPASGAEGAGHFTARSVLTLVSAEAAFMVS